MEAESRYYIPNLERTLEIIEFLAKHPNAYRISELADALGFPKNSVFRILKTLLKHEYLTESRNHYQLSTKFLAVGSSALGEENLITKAMDSMINLRNESHETVLLGKQAGNQGVILETVMSDEPIKFFIDVGHIFQLHTSAPGKAFLAYAPEDERELLLNTMEYTVYNENTIRSKEAMLPELEKVREKGYSFDMGEKISGLHCLAAPIFNFRKKVIAALWMTGPSFRMPVERFDEYGEMVKRHAYAVSSLLGYNRGIHEIKG